MHLALSRRLAVLLVAAVALTAVPVALPGRAVAAPVVQRSGLGTAPAAVTPLARLGGFRSSRRYTSPYYRRTYRRPFGGRGAWRGFWHGLFWGWMLSHFFGFGFGIPLFIPFLLLVVALMAFRRRRPPAYRSRMW